MSYNIKTIERIRKLAESIPVYPDFIRMDMQKIPCSVPICTDGDRKVSFPYAETKQNFLNDIEYFIGDRGHND